MKRYMKYKNFIPIEVIEDFQKSSYRTNKRLIIILLILNIICFPKTLANIREILRENNIRNRESVSVIGKVEEDINKENLYKIISYIDNYVNYIEFKNNSGIFEIKNENKIFSIEKENKLFIHSINKIDKNKFVLEVSL